MKETPKEAKIVSHQLLLRAGYIKQLIAGVYDYLPLMHRVLQKVTQIVREEMNKKGCEELLMPALQPKDFWVETDRWERYTAIDGIMFAFEDRRGGTVCLGPTHEEIITDIVRREINTYKHLPVNLYQIQTKFRDEIRPRFGLMRAREFIMKDAYSFDRDEKGLDKSFDDMEEAYCRVCDRCGVDYRCVEADPGAIGGSGSKEFMVLAETGEDTVMYCNSCDYAANLEKAESRLEEFPQDKEKKPMHAVYGKGLIGVNPLAKFLKIPVWKTTKTLLYEADDKVVAVAVRGDCNVNEIKVVNFLGCKVLQLASPEKVKKATGAEVGYAGIVNLPKEIQVIADHYVGNRINFECGANKTDYHNINVNFERDCPLPTFGDFKAAKVGDICPRCDKGKLKETKGIEAGHIFKLGTKYSKPMNCNYSDEKGKKHPMEMGCYGIGISRMPAAAIEQNHDARGIIWPISMAPYHVHLVGLQLDDGKVKKEVEKVYELLKKEKMEVFYDDRENIRPGEKFADADLIGLPFRITISKKTIAQKKVEFKRRRDKKAEMLGRDKAVKLIKDEVEKAEVPEIYLG